MKRAEFHEEHSAKAAMRQWYREYLPERSLEEDTFLHQLGGVVVDEPDFFLLARGVDLEADWELIVEPAVLFPRSLQNCWFIWARWGPVARILTVAPYYLPFTAWSRRGKPFTVYRTQEALRLIEATTKLRAGRPAELHPIAP